MVDLRVEISVLERLSAFHLQVAHGLLDHRIGDLVGGSDGSTGGHSAGEHDVQSGSDRIPAHGVEGQLGLTVQPVAHRLRFAVNVPQVDFIGVAHPAAVVLRHHGERGLGQALTIGGHAFKQGFVNRLKLGVAEERDVFAVVLRLFDHLGILHVAEVRLHIFQGPSLEIGLQQGRGNTSRIAVVGVGICHLSTLLILIGSALPP